METWHEHNHDKDRPLFDDEKIFSLLFKAYYPRLISFTRKYIADYAEAEDILQDIFLRVWIKRKDLKEGTFHTYLFTSVRNACLNHVKHQKIAHAYRIDLEANAEVEGLYYADFYSDPLHQTIYNEVRDEIETVIQNLPEQTRNVFRLSRIEGLKNTEIAEKLKVSVRTVEKHNTKALHKLKVWLSSRYLFVMAVMEMF